MRPFKPVLNENHNWISFNNQFPKNSSNGYYSRAYETKNNGKFGHNIKDNYNRNGFHSVARPSAYISYNSKPENVNWKNFNSSDNNIMAVSRVSIVDPNSRFSVRKFKTDYN